MLKVSFQGQQLTAGQKQRLEQEQRVKNFLSSPLQEQVDQTLQILEKRKADGAKSEPLWTHAYTVTGTPSVAEWMGY